VGIRLLIEAASHSRRESTAIVLRERKTRERFCSCCDDHWEYFNDNGKNSDCDRMLVMMIMMIVVLMAMKNIMIKRATIVMEKIMMVQRIDDGCEFMKKMMSDEENNECVD
jgi:hypothetical protein